LPGNGKRHSRVFVGRTPFALRLHRSSAGTRFAADVIMISIQGVDTSIGLACNAQNESLYLRLLQMFRDDEREFPDRFRSLVSMRRHEEARRMAFDLRNVAGRLGAIELASYAALLESALRRQVEEGILDSYVGAVERSLTPVLADLDRVL
jgi:HPt (histidine-containing phosphotransfer) domain-containing protein